ncbi:hypothetical protein AYJ57_24465 (plasmid) [Salipiger sp. CCB-MM3]|uniref:glycosyltransferase family 87 protein n=1 Tax=Salipiger sp. CCB-MM3 TaxID=1792508 RepID=UPI00080AA3F4|nr:glycosyltransferase family 87 protein [Salipiger sp. CCB-MM3]ANT63633.1 hypothetical protein AYJ57_24465 [Salipiger sp. CCB-MM3]
MQDSSPALAETALPGARVPGEPVLFRLSAMSRAVLMAMLLAMLLFATAQHMGGLFGKDPLFLDFNVFYMVGEYVWQGRVAETYDFGLFAPAQDAVNGPDQGFMPWTYPAQMDLFVALLALLPRWLAYFAFAAGSLAGFLWVLKRLAGVHFDAALVLVLPALMVTLLTGQNGMMTAALVGSYALLALRGTGSGSGTGSGTGSGSAGVPLGLMAIKPHLAVGLALHALMTGRWKVLAVSVAVTLAAVAAATLAFGPGIWAVVAQSARDSGTYLAEGRYPLFRMSSVYAGLRNSGASADLAFAAQASVAALALGLVAALALRRWQPRRLLGVALLSSYAVSPYNYDYDLCALGMALALLLPDAARFAGVGGKIALAVCCWSACGLAVFGASVPGRFDSLMAALSMRGEFPSIATLGYLGAFGLLLCYAVKGERAAGAGTY